MNKKLITIAEIVFAVVFIILMSQIFGTVNTFGTSINTKLVNIQQSINESDMTAYDGSVVSGDSVRSMINNMKETRNGIKLSYMVVNDASQTGYGYNAITTDTTNTALDSNGDVIENFGLQDVTSTYNKYDITTKISDDEFINPVDKYQSYLVFNANGAIVGVTFGKVED